MEHVQLGQSGLRVSPISFGTWQLSPRFWGEQSSEEIARAIRRAFDGGINLFDTADAYGDGHAETVLGETIADLPRDELVITTKVLARFKPDGSRVPDLSAENIAARCEVSLGRLQIDTIDLYLLHGFDPLTPPRRDRRAARPPAGTGEDPRLRREQSRRRASPRAAPLRRLLRRAGALQHDRSGRRGRPAAVLPGRGHRRDGLLAAAQGPALRQVPGHRDLHRLPAPTIPTSRASASPSCARTYRAWAPIAERYNLSIYQLALAATAQHPSIHTAVCGIKTVDQIEEALGAAGTVLSRDDLTAARAAVGPGSRRTADARGVRK